MTERSCNTYFLVGPTAVGKTAVSHAIAKESGYAILSADAMLVYRGMDIGTAKPTPEEREEVHYLGLDLASPSTSFSVGQYYEAVTRELRDLRESGKRVIVTGGTGLYVRCLLEGLADVPEADASTREEARQVLETQGVEDLQALVKAEAPEHYAGLADPQNPRRLIRALEMARAGTPSPRTWSERPQGYVAGLQMDRDRLLACIEKRVDVMYAAGLLDEAERLSAEYGELSETARQAIGYREAFAVLAGEMDVETAKAQTVTRTRRLAKRQMTWFRHQLDVDWIEVSADEPTTEVEHKVRTAWETNGPTETAI